LHVSVHALDWHEGRAFATLVEHRVPQLPQLFALLVMSTHAPEHSVGVVPEQPDTHVPAEQAGVPASALHACPQDPQLFLSVCSSTQAPPHGVKPELQAKPQVPPEHVAVAFATVVVHRLPHRPQFCVLVCSSTHVPPQRLVPDEQPETHTAGPPPSMPPSAAAAEQTGAPASALQATPQKPQFCAVSSVTHTPLQSV
jgi:hypothetical protein